MASTLDEVKDLKIYNQGFYMPVNDDDRKNGSLVFLMTPSLSASKRALYNLSFTNLGPSSIKGLNNFPNYYMEKDISFYLNESTHIANKINDYLLLEDSSYESKQQVLGTLSEFRRLEINETSIEEYITAYDEVQGIVEYYPWTGYFYVDESDKLIAGVNVNEDSRIIQKIFVTEDKYAYLYNELINEARKLKGNIIVCDKNDKCIKPLEEFGFSVVDSIEDKVKLQFKVPIEESVKFYNINHDFHAYINNDSKYKINGNYNKTLTNALIDSVEYYMRKLNYNPNIGYLAAKCFTLEGYTEKLLKDLQLRKWFSETDIAIAISAISDAIVQGEPHSIYSRIMMDSSFMIHHIDIDLIIMDTVERYFDEYSLEPRDFLFNEEVPIIEEMIRDKYSKHSINDWTLRVSYDYYRDKRGKLMSALKKKLDYKIRTMYHVRSNEVYQEGSNLLLEANVSFGYDEESYCKTNEEWESLKLNGIDPEYGFTHSDSTNGIVISDRNIVKGSVHISEDGSIADMYSTDISYSYLITIAGRKFNANKASIPLECTSIIEAMDNNIEWTCVRIDDKCKYYETNSNIDRMKYPHVNISQDEIDLYKQLEPEYQKEFTNHYLDDTDVSNTIWRKTYKDIGFVNLYTLPEFPKIAFVNMAILKEQRHKGYSSIMMEDIDNVLRSKFHDIMAIGWSCNDNNIASYKTAIKNHFEPYSQQRDRLVLIKHIHTFPLQSNVFTESYVEDNTIDPSYLDESLNYQGVYTLLQEEADRKLGSTNNQKLKRILWDDRIKNDKKVLAIYKDVKKDILYIKNTYIKLEQYKGKNLIYDLSYYMNSFINNYNKVISNNNVDTANRFYFDFLSRLLRTKKFKDYNKFTCLIPISEWKDDVFNPINLFIHMRHKYPELLKTLDDIDFVFYTYEYQFFKFNFNKNDLDLPLFKSVSKSLISKSIPIEITRGRDNNYTKKALMHTLLDKMELQANVKIQSINANKQEDSKKKEIVDKLDKASNTATNPDEVEQELDKDEEKVQELIDNIIDDEPGNVKISAARSKRLNTLCQQFLNQKVVDEDRRYVGDMKKYLSYNQYTNELPETALPIDSLNEDWQHMKYTNFEKVYNLRADIYNILYFLASRSIPLAIYKKIDIEDRSTTEDWVETWTVPFESNDGKRFNFKFDLPILKDNRFMVLGGNDKTINAQLVLIPISKTETDTAQIVSNYNKIFIRRYSSGICKANRNSDFFAKFVEIMAKEHPEVLQITYGNSNLSNSKYLCPYDYVNICGTYYSININYKNSKLFLSFSQDNIREILQIKDSDNDFYLGYMESSGKKTPIKLDLDKFTTCSAQIISCMREFLNGSDYFTKYFDKLKPASKYCYSRASILGTEIPVIIMMAYSEGLQEALRKGHIEYQISEKRIDSIKDTHDCIRFKDCYLYYKDTYNASLLMNGLKEVDTKDYSFQEVDNKTMWVVFLDDFGGRIKADGLDNFYDLMIDPITREVCIDYKLPTDYCELLAYSNLLLADNAFAKHTDLSTNRFRSNELVAAKAYKCIATAYSQYRIQRKKERKDVIMTMKQTAIIDALLTENTMSDMSFNNPLGELESKNTVSFKGHVGLNSDRSYGIDKRNYDPSMINKIALSTGFAGNVGVNRQTTINMNIKGTRGYIKNTSINDATTANTLSMTEALTPFGSTRDDPFRTAMTNIQTSKHNMRTKRHDPLLVSCGADQAIAYLTGDSYAFKAKANGKVVKATKDYIVVEYDGPINTFDPYNQKPSKDGVLANKVREIIDLREIIKKNSDGGFYITVKLDSELKTGQRFKAMDILAYDKSVYSNTSGDGKHITYDLGPLANIAYINTDEGFEDSGIISDRLAEALTSEVVVMISKNLPANSNVYNMVSKGDKILEGDTLMLYQTPFDEEDANTIVRNLAAMNQDDVNELGRIPVKSKVTGIVQDIKIYRTVELNEMSPSLKKIVKAYEETLAPIAKEAANADNKIDLDPNYKLAPVSKMKNCDGKVKIEFYLKYNDKMGIGDKLVFFSAIKGETKTIFPKGLEPYTDRQPGEIIDSLCPLPSVLHRMVASVKILTGLNKGVIELTRYMKEAIGLKYKPYNPRINSNQEK